MRSALVLGLWVVPFAIACDGAPVDTFDDYDAGSPGGGYDAALIRSGDSGAAADSAPSIDSGAAEAATPIPPISAATPGNAPALCVGGGQPSAYVMVAGGTVFNLNPSSLEMQSLGVVNCDANADPVAFSATAADTAYILYTDGGLYRANLQTLACQGTPYLPNQIGFTGRLGITVGSGDEADRLYVYGQAATPTLGVSDLSTFRLFQVGPVTPIPAQPAVDVKTDAYGRLFTLATDGTLSQLDPATGVVLGLDATGFAGQSRGDTNGVNGTALMAYDGQLYFFGGQAGGVSRYDLATKSLFPVGAVNQLVVGASASPCMSAPTPSADSGSADGQASDGDTSDAGSPSPPGPSNAFAPGEAWIGTYECSEGLTNLALVIERVDGSAVQARFDFDASGTQGSFEVSGNFNPATREATFTPGSWVLQPSPSWPGVAMDGYVDLGGTSYAGSIPSEGCGAFSLTR
jgi:hypothetical protein